MDILELFKQIFSIGMAVLAALVLAFYVIWPQVENFFLRANQVSANRVLDKDLQQLKFAAYERLLLFVHRISPYQIMIRNHENNISINQFYQKLINDLENEFQHNFTQQLYVSDVSWQAVKDLKLNTQALLKNTKTVIGNDSPVDEYVALVLKHVSELEVNPFEAAQIILKKELYA